MIDLHSHIINGVDDGSPSEEETLQMLKLAEDSGTTAIVATPHYIPDRYEHNFYEILKRFEKLKAITKENNINIDLYCGQEVYYTKNILDLFNDKLIGTINNTRYMLIELPILDFNLEEVIDVIYELKIRGIVPVIAHPERYKPFIKEPSLINTLIEEEYLFQLNTGSLLGYFGKEVKKLAELYCENNIYSFVGTDAHRINGRNTDMNSFLSIIDINTAENYEENSEKLLKNEDVVFCGVKINRKKKFLGIF